MENTRFIRLEATRYPITSNHERHRSDEQPTQSCLGRVAPRGCMTLRVIFRCPRCGSRAIRISSRQNRVDRFLALFRLCRHRCELCRCRFYLPRMGAARSAT
jgi:hypothetical protein